MLNSFREMCSFGELQIDGKMSNFEIFESTLCMKSGSMPLSLKIIQIGTGVKK